MPPRRDARGRAFRRGGALQGEPAHGTGRAGDRGRVLGVGWRERTRQLPWVGAKIAICFLFHTFLAHRILALLLGPSTLAHAATSWQAFLSPDGRLMIGVQVLVGGASAFLLHRRTVVGLPLLLGREADVVSAMLPSIRDVSRNRFVLGTWAPVVAGTTLAAMVPRFPGLNAVLPILGPATWHLYRRALA